jgi:hypothetical protein
MHAKFNYVFFVIRILFVLAWSALGIVLLYMLPGEESQKHDLSGVIGIMAAFLFVFGLFTFKFWRAIWTERFGMIITRDEVIIKDHLCFKTSILRPDEIKGFRLSQYPIRIKGVKSIFLCLKDGRKIEFPQFLFLNFKKMAAALEECGIAFLG